MKKTLWAGLAIGLLTLSTAGVLNAAMILSDNFDGENWALNKNDFVNWNIPSGTGTVDLIGVETDWNFFPSYGNYVDLDGSTWKPGAFTSKTFFDSGSYILSFDLAGSQRGNLGDYTNTVTVTLGDWTETFTVLSGESFKSYTRTINAASGGALAFQNSGGDNIGLLLDNVSVSKPSNPVPEPATMLLLGTGIVGLAAVGRRKKS